MGFETKPKASLSTVQNIEGGPPHVFFTDMLGGGFEKPIVGSWFRLEQGPIATPPTYDYEEVGVVFEGTVTLHDEQQGKQQTLTAGDSFVIHKGSTIGFSTTDYGICFKCGAREMARL